MSYRLGRKSGGKNELENGVSLSHMIVSEETILRNNMLK